MNFFFSQINVALYASTPSSLLILDEFGVGTTEIDGAALLTAVLKSFLDRGIQCPHIFAATHIHRVTELLPQSRMIEAQVNHKIMNERIFSLKMRFYQQNENLFSWEEKKVSDLFIKSITFSDFRIFVERIK